MNARTTRVRIRTHNKSRNDGSVARNSAVPFPNDEGYRGDASPAIPFPNEEALRSRGGSGEYAVPEADDVPQTVESDEPLTERIIREFTAQNFAEVADGSGDVMLTRPQFKQMVDMLDACADLLKRMRNEVRRNAKVADGLREAGVPSVGGNMTVFDAMWKRVLGREISVA